MALYKSSTAYTRTFLLVQSADHLSALTGASPTVTLSKAGAAFGAAGGTVTEVGSGWYKIVLTTTDTNTLGDLAFHVTAASADDTDFVDQIVAVDFSDATAFGLSRLDAAITTRLAPTVAARTLDVTATGEAGIDWANIGAPTTTVNLSGTTVGTLTTNSDKTGYALSAAGVQAIWDALTSALTTAGSIGKLLVDNINATISSRMATFTLPTNFSALSITAGGLVDITQAAADKVWSTAARVLTAGTNIVLAKGTGVTGFTDISASGVENAVWDGVRASHTTAGTFGQGAASVQGNVTGSVASVTGAVGSVTGAVGSVAAGGITSASFGVGAIDTVAFPAATREANADALIGRNIAGAANGGRTVKMALARLVNRVKIAAGVLTVYDTDDASSLYTQNVTTTAGNPISEVDTV